MRRAHYSSRAPAPVDMGALVRYSLIVLVMGLVLYWLATGPAQAWFESLTDWLRDL